jgi:hypothetical protein
LAQSSLLVICKIICDDVQIFVAFIHVLGGLDPFMTPLYFLAGADVIDSLTWLRMGFTDGGARYLPGLAAMAESTVSLKEAEWRIRRANFGGRSTRRTRCAAFCAACLQSAVH